MVIAYYINTSYKFHLEFPHISTSDREESSFKLSRSRNSGNRLWHLSSWNKNAQPLWPFVDKIEDLIHVTFDDIIISFLAGKERMTGIFLSIFIIQHTSSSGVFTVPNVLNKPVCAVDLKRFSARCTKYRHLLS